MRFLWKLTAAGWCWSRHVLFFHSPTYLALSPSFCTGILYIDTKGASFYPLSALFRFSSFIYYPVSLQYYMCSLCCLFNKASWLFAYSPPYKDACHPKAVALVQYQAYSPQCYTTWNKFLKHTRISTKMRNMPSRFIEILDAEDSSHLRMSASDVRLEDVLADHEATVNRHRSSTQSSSSKVSLKFRTDQDRDQTPSPSQRLKRLSNILRRDGKDGWIRAYYFSCW